MPKNRNNKVPTLIQSIFLISLLITSLPLNFCSRVNAAAIKPAPLKAQIEFRDKASLNLKLIPETIVDTELTLVGDFFSAYLTKPSADILKIPFGSRLIGSITDIKDSKSFNRDAKLRAHVDRIMLPDGSVVRVSADISSDASEATIVDDKAKFKNIAKKVAKESAELSASALVGAIDSVQITGLTAAIATHGISAGVGAAIGLGMGLAHTIGKDGQTIASSGFKPLNFKLESEFKLLEEMPLMYENFDPISASLLGIDVKVNSMQKVFSKNYGEFILVELNLTNHTDRKLYLGDFVLRSAFHVLPVYSNPLLTNNYSDSIAAKSNGTYKIAFSLGSYNKKENYQLMIVDPVTDTIVANADINIASYL